MHGHGANTQNVILSRDSQWNPDILEIETPGTLEAHNFVCRPLIKVRFYFILFSLVESFPMVCGMSPARNEIRAILDF
jgi:hypothetical protein